MARQSLGRTRSCLPLVLTRGVTLLLTLIDKFGGCGTANSTWLLVHAYRGIVDVPGKINSDAHRRAVIFYSCNHPIPPLSHLAMSFPKSPVVFRGPVDPNAKRKPSKLEKFVTAARIATREFQENQNSLICHAYPRGKARCQKKCTPSQLELQRAAEVINEKSLPYDPHDAVAVSYALLCATHWGQTMFGQTLFLDLILGQSPNDHETPTTASVPAQELQVILAPKPPKNEVLPGELLDFSLSQLRRACNNLDEDSKEDPGNTLIQALPPIDGSMLVLRIESRLRTNRQRWELSPSSSTSWRGPAHLDYSVARTALTFDHKSGFRCIAYDADEHRCDHVLAPDECGSVRDAFGCEFTIHIPPRLLEQAITRLLCSEHRNAYWKHVYYQKWAPGLVGSDDSSRKSPSSGTSVQSPSVGCRKVDTSSTSSKGSVKSEEPTHDSNEAVLSSSCGKPDPFVFGKESELFPGLPKTFKLTDPFDFIPFVKKDPSTQGENPGTPPLNCTTPDETIRGSRPSPPRPEPSSSAGSKMPNAPKSDGVGNGMNQKATKPAFSFEWSFPSSGAAFRVKSNVSQTSETQQRRNEGPRWFPELRVDSPSPSKPSIFRFDPYRIDYHSFNDDASRKLLANERGLLRDLERIQKGSGLIPSYVRDVSKLQPQGRKLEDKYFSAWKLAGEKAARAMEEAVYEWFRVCDLHAAASECQHDQLFEAAWNAEVHSTVLRLALQGRRREETGVWYRDVTTATILESCLHLSPFSTTRTSGKRVDYAIILEPSEELRPRIKDKVERSFSTTINHTAQEHIRYKPIAIGIETKRLSQEKLKADQDKQKADEQLLVWVSGHFTRLRQLLSTKQSQEIPALPLLLVQGHDWKLYMAKVGENPLERKLDLFQEMIIGSTASIVGIYTLLAALRRLAEWAEKKYGPWFVESILD